MPPTPLIRHSRRALYTSCYEWMNELQLLYYYASAGYAHSRLLCFHYVSLFRTPSVCPVPMDSSARRASPLHICIGRGIIWSPSLNGKGEGLDTCYGATYMSQTRDQQRFTISEVAADWHTIAPISHTSLHPLAGATTYFPSRWGTWVGLSTG